MKELPVKRVQVISGDGMDEILLYLDLPSPSFPYAMETVCQIKAAQGSGRQWVINHIGIEPN